MKKRSKTLILGNVLIALSLFLLLFIYYPVIRLYFFPNNSYSPALNTDSYIEIKSINAILPIIFNIDPFNAKEYEKALENGVAHAKGTSLPGEKGTVFIFGHSSGAPWQITRYNTAFFRLGELKTNDKILIYRDGKKYEYKVADAKIVWPSEVNFLKENKIEQLILQTCYPIGTDFQRLLVFADPVY